MSRCRQWADVRRRRADERELTSVRAPARAGTGPPSPPHTHSISSSMGSSSSKVAKGAVKKFPTSASAGEGGSVRFQPTPTSFPPRPTVASARLLDSQPSAPSEGAHVPMEEPASHLSQSPSGDHRAAEFQTPGELDDRDGEAEQGGGPRMNASSLVRATAASLAHRHPAGRLRSSVPVAAVQDRTGRDAVQPSVQTSTGPYTELTLPSPASARAPVLTSHPPFVLPDPVRPSARVLPLQPSLHLPSCRPDLVPDRGCDGSRTVLGRAAQPTHLRRDRRPALPPPPRPQGSRRCRPCPRVQRRRRRARERPRPMGQPRPARVGARAPGQDQITGDRGLWTGGRVL